MAASIDNLSLAFSCEVLLDFRMEVRKEMLIQEAMKDSLSEDVPDFQ